MIERIGRYRIVKKLGEGGQGVVYVAEDERLGRQVALKVVRAEYSGSGGRERLWREARAAAATSHPNICQLYAIEEQDDTLFLVMELLEGESLATRLEHGPLPVSVAADIALQMLAALQALHRRGLVHRDVKPSNVFLATLGVKLLDFGLVRTLEHDPNYAPAWARIGRIYRVLGLYMIEQSAADNLARAEDAFARALE